MPCLFTSQPFSAHHGAAHVQDLLQQMLQDWLKIPKSQRWPFHLQEHVTMAVYEHCNLLFVAFTLENMQPLQILEALRAITTLLQSAFGGLTEEKARAMHLALPPVCRSAAPATCWRCACSPMGRVCLRIASCDGGHVTWLLGMH